MFQCSSPDTWIFSPPLVHSIPIFVYQTQSLPIFLSQMRSLPFSHDSDIGWWSWTIILTMMFQKEVSSAVLGKEGLEKIILIFAHSHFPYYHNRNVFSSGQVQTRSCWEFPSNCVTLQRKYCPMKKAIHYRKWKHNFHSSYCEEI